MPVYLYKCPKCDYESEELVLDKSKASSKQCPKCEKTKMVKQPTSAFTKGGSSCSSCPGSCNTCG